MVGRLTREARFVGGHGAEYVEIASANGNGNRKSAKGVSVVEGDEYGDGRDLLSAGWGNGHDGAGFEILSAEFVEVCSSFKLLILLVRLVFFSNMLTNPLFI